MHIIDISCSQKSYKYLKTTLFKHHYKYLFYGNGIWAEAQQKILIIKQQQILT